MGRTDEEQEDLTLTFIAGGCRGWVMMAMTTMGKNGCARPPVISVLGLCFTALFRVLLFNYCIQVGGGYGGRACGGKETERIRHRLLCLGWGPSSMHVPA